MSWDLIYVGLIGYTLGFNWNYVGFSNKHDVDQIFSHHQNAG